MIRRRMMLAQGGVSLPAGYTKIEYLESDGSQFIDTGYKPNNNTRVVMDVQATSIPDTICAFGSRSSATANAMFAFFHKGDNVWRADYVTSSTRKTFASIGGLDRVRIDFDKNICTINDVVQTWTASTYQSPYNLTLLAVNTANTPQFVMPAKLYSCQIYDNGTLVRDFIPAMNASGETGLYDLKNDVWYALLPVAKPKVENKIRVEMGYCSFREVYNPMTGNYEELYICEVLAIADYSVESNITIKFRRNTGANTETVRLNRGYKNRVLFDYNPQLSGINPSITSISPTEDDTYIYTF